MHRRLQYAATWVASALAVVLLAGSCETPPPEDWPEGSRLDDSSAEEIGEGAPARPGRRFASLVVIRPDKVEDFRDHFLDVPEEIQTLLQEHHIRNFSIFLYDQTVEVFAVRYFEYIGEDYPVDLAQLNANPAFRRWQSRYEECQVSLADDRVLSTEPWAPMEEVFHNP